MRVFCASIVCLQFACRVAIARQCCAHRLSSVTQRVYIACLACVRSLSTASIVYPSRVCLVSFVCLAPSVVCCSSKLCIYSVGRVDGVSMVLLARVFRVSVCCRRCACRWLTGSPVVFTKIMHDSYRESVVRVLCASGVCSRVDHASIACQYVCTAVPRHMSCSDNGVVMRSFVRRSLVDRPPAVFQSSVNALSMACPMRLSY